MLTLYAIPFLKAFIIAFCFSLAISFFPWGKKFFSPRKSARHVHGRNIPRLGGAAVILGFIIALISDSNLVITAPLWGIIIASMVILIYGIWDDFRELDWRLQLFFQLCAALIIFIAGVQIEYVANPFGGIIDMTSGKWFVASLFFGIGWILALMNSMNWLDGSDGLSGGISFIATLTIFFLSIGPNVNQPPVGIITVALAGAILGFLILNFNPSYLLAGTSGSVFFGFILASIAIFAGVKVATALLVLAIPIFDAFFVVWERFKKGRSIFLPDKKHLHYRLFELGWSQKKVALSFYGITILIGVVALNVQEMGKIIAISLVFLIMLGFFWVISSKLKNGLNKNEI